MQIIYWGLSQLLSYSWLFFVIGSFFVARLFGVAGMILGHVVVAIAVTSLDIQWIQSEMHKSGWDGQPDQDFIFMIGVALRIFLINAVLLPISLIGWRLRHLGISRNGLQVILMITVCLNLAGCVIVPESNPRHPLDTNLTIIDSITRQPIPDAQVVLFAQRLNAYFPDGKPGAEKSPSIFVRRLDQAAKITLTDNEVYFLPFFAVGTVYYRTHAWVYKPGYIPIDYKYPPWDSDQTVAVTAEMQPCERWESEQTLFGLLSREIPRLDWRMAAEESIRKQLH